MPNVKVTIGIISFQDQKYLQQLIPTLLNQTHKNLEILVCDNNDDPNAKIAKFLNKNFPTVKVLSAGGNVGFSAAHNHLMSKATADYYLCLNSDISASPTFIEELLKPFQTNSNLAVVAPKLLQWTNFPEDPTKISQNIIDTAGTIAYKWHRFLDKGQGQLDAGQFNHPQEIWGASGAAALFHLPKLRAVQQSPNEIFDQNFFMYKEDIDLIYRLRWAGFTVFYQPTAVAWHDRTIEKEVPYSQRPEFVRQYSFLNQLILTYKNWSPEYSLETHFKTAAFHLSYMAYLLIFDFKTLKLISKFRFLYPDIKQQKKQMPRGTSPKQMQSWLN